MERTESHGSNGPWGNLDHLYGTLQKGNAPGEEREAEAAAVGGGGGSDDETEARGNTDRDRDRDDGGRRRGGGGGGGGSSNGLGLGDGSGRSSGRSFGGGSGDGSGRARKRSVLGMTFGALGSSSRSDGRSHSNHSGFSALPGADHAHDDDEHNDDYSHALHGSDRGMKGGGGGGRGGLPPNPLNLKSVTFAQARPTFRAILLTTALLLSSASTLGCRYMTVDVGFVPANLAFNATKIDLGIFSFPPDAVGGGGDRCLAYPDGFTDAFISGDGSWSLARGAGIISIVLGWVALMISWLLVVGVLKPKALRYKIALAFISAFLVLFESLKFIFLQVSLCTSEVWDRRYDTGVVAPAFVKSCSLTRNGNMSVAATMLYLVLVVLLCRSRMREEMGAGLHQAGRKATRFRYEHGRRTSYAGGGGAGGGEDGGDDDELESMGMGDEEREADMALSDALAALESKRFTFDSRDDNSFAGDNDSSNGMEARAVSGAKTRRSGSGLEDIEEGGSDEAETEEDSVDAGERREVGRSAKRETSWTSRSDAGSVASHRSSFSAMSDFY